VPTESTFLLKGYSRAERCEIQGEGIFTVTLISGVLWYVLQRKRGEDEQEDTVEDDEVADGKHQTPPLFVMREYNCVIGITRANALVLRGTPLSRLPTGRIFGYAKYFDLAPTALEWIDDISCVLVFSSALACREAQVALSSKGRRPDEQAMDMDEEGYAIAKSVPAPLWPPEDRINRSLGVGDGLKGVLRMRVARFDDVKKRGARNNSEFYRKHGSEAGKDPAVNALRMERKFGTDGVDEEQKRRQLDDELDNFLAQDEDVENGSSGDPDLSQRISTPNPNEDYDSTTLSRMRSDALGADVRSSTTQNKRARTSLGDRLTNPTSKMRADYLDGTGRSLLERTSLMRANDDDLEYEGQGGREWDRQKDTVPQEGHRRRRRRGGRDRGAQGGTERRVVTAQQLDDELDAFLNEK